MKNASFLRLLLIALSFVATASIFAAPAITVVGNTRRVLTPGQSASLSVTATGNGALSYQWMHNGHAMAGAASSSVSLPSAAITDNGYFMVEVTDTDGTALSAAFFVTVAPAVTQVVTWGSTAFGAMNVPANLTNAIAVSSDGFHSIALKSDGTVVVWGENVVGLGNVPPGLTDVVAVDTSNSVSLALKSDGTVVGWGNNSFSNQATVPPGLSNVVAVAASGNHCLALKSDGTVISWGELNGQIADLQDVVSIAAGVYHSVALRRDGTVKVWMNIPDAYPDYDQVAQAATLSDVAAISAGAYFTLALKNDGTVTGIGSNSDGQLDIPAGLSNVVAISACGLHSMALKSDGTLVAWGYNGYEGHLTGQADVPVGVTNKFAMAGGDSFSVALRDAALDLTPTITTQPQALTRVVGTSATFTAAASGTPDPTYQWTKNGANIAGATSASYTIASVVPGDAATYRMVATNSAGSIISQGAFLTVNKITATVTLGSLAATYNGSPKSATATTNPAGKTVTFTYDGLSTAPTNAGSYAVVGTLDDPDYQGSASGTLVIAKVTPTVSWPAVGAIVYGTPLSSTQLKATANVPGTFVYNPAAGTVLDGGFGQTLNVTFTPTDTTNYNNQTATQSVSVLKASAIVTLSGLNTTYDGTPKAVTVTTSPVGLNVTVTYNGSTTPPTTAGSYSVSAAISDVNYQGGNSGTLVIAKTNPVITWPSPASILYGAALSGTQLNATADVPGNFVYTPAVGTVPNAGNQTLSVTFTPTNTATYNTVTVQRTIIVSQFPGVVAVSAGGTHSLFIRADGTLWGMGGNGFGQLGDGTNTDRSTPIQIATNVVAAAAGSGGHTLFIKADGTLWSMGNNQSGELADGTQTNRNTPKQVATGVVAAVAGEYHSLFLKSDGSLWSVGGDGVGQLGNGNTTRTGTPFQVTTNVIAVSAGGGHSLFIKSDGSLWVMGDNAMGQIGTGNLGESHVPVQIATGVISVVGKYWHSEFLNVDGTVWGMGHNDSGEVGDDTTTRRYTPVQTLFAAGTIAKLVSGSGEYSLVIKTDDTLWGVGSNGLGQFGDGSTSSHLLLSYITSGVATAATGKYHTLIVGKDGTLRTTGDNYYGQLGDGTTTSHLSPVTIAGGPLLIPSAPTGVTASDGVSGQMVRLTWNPSLGATKYQVWRNTANDPAGAVLVGDNLPFPLYYDNSVVAATTYYYWIVALNPVGVTSVASASDSGYAANPIILTQPQSLFVQTGRTATFMVGAAGTPAPTYQWKKNGIDIPGATAATFMILGSTASDAGSYTVVVTNTLSSVTSAAAVLTVLVGAAQNDFNADGNAELVWQNAATGERALWLMNGTTFISSVSLGSMVATWKIGATGDFNSDGKIDIVWQNTATGERRIWLMNGTTFGSSVSLGTVGTEWVIVGAGDFNGDGKTDLVWQNTQNGWRALWLMNDTAYGSTVMLPNISINWLIAGVVDFNGDGMPDLLWRNPSTGENVVWLMNGATLASTIALETSSIEWTIADTGDYNGDGKPDIVWTNTITGERFVWLMNGTTHASTVSLGVISLDWVLGHPALAFTRLARTDFNLDDKSDILWQNTTTGERFVWLMNGSVRSGDMSLGTVPTEWSMVASADFNGDGLPDILWQNTVTGERYLWLMNGNMHIADLSLGVVPTEWSMVAAADFNFDGKPDILWENTTTGQRYLWFMNGTSHTGDASLGIVSTQWKIAGAADFNNDGTTDILWRNTATGEHVVWYMSGTSYAASAGLATMSLDWSIAAVADYNGDGKPDIIWQNSATGQRLLWLMDGVTRIGDASLDYVPVEWSIVK